MSPQAKIPDTFNATRRAEVLSPFSIQQHSLAHPPAHLVLLRIAHPSPPAEQAASPHCRTYQPISESSRASSNVGAPAPSPPWRALEFPGFAPAPLHALPPTHEHRRSNPNAFSTSAPANQINRQASRPWKRDSRVP